MNAVILAMTMLGQIPQFGPQSQWGWDGTVHNNSGWGYRKLYGNGYYPPQVFVSRAAFVRPPSPTNIIAAQMRASKASRPRSLSSRTIAGLIELAEEKERLWAILLESEPEDKKEAREEYLAARRRLDRARFIASRELH